MNTLKLLVLAPFATVPPRYGGPIRIYSLCRELSTHMQVLTYAQQAQRAFIGRSFSPIYQRVTSGFAEYSSRNPANLGLYALTSLKWNCPPVWESVSLDFTAPDWLRERVDEADVIQVEGPWQFRWVHALAQGRKPIILDAHNAEFDLYTRERMSVPHPLMSLVLREIDRQERFAMHNASQIFTVSKDDALRLAGHYSVNLEKFRIVPNGVDCDKFTPASPAERMVRKQQLGLTNRYVVAFSGSLHRPNVEAAEAIWNWAEKWEDDDITFLIIGTVGRAFAGRSHPKVVVTGSVETTKEYFEAADAAINPMRSGSGTNLKQLEFMAMGLPTVSSPTGARGLGIIDGVTAFVRDIHAIPDQIRWLRQHPSAAAEIAMRGRAYVAGTYDWRVIVARSLETYVELVKKHS